MTSPPSRPRRPLRAAILNAGAGAWAFEALADRLSRALWVDVVADPDGLDYCYLLGWNDPKTKPRVRKFIDPFSIEMAADKRLLEVPFAVGRVPRPTTYICSMEGIERMLRQDERQWVLKWPTGCGGAGHRLYRLGDPIPPGWPLPYLLQEFIPLPEPEVYRLYCAGGALFGWNARRFPKGTSPTPWVAHARGARYFPAGEPPPEAVDAARRALQSVSMFHTFGCVDLIHAPDGRWLVLEVGTDGIYNHVDRDLGLPELELELDRRVAKAFWACRGKAPWKPGPWRYRDS